MQIAPHTKEQWFDLVLLPAKVFLVVAIVVLILRLRLQGLTPSANQVIGCCFLLSGPFLLLGALLQSIFCQRGSASRTLIFIGIVSAIAYSSSWWGGGGFLIMGAGWLMWRFIRSVEHHVSKSEEPIECLECHSIIPVGESRCSHCGWTFKI